jgi:hypothetical protein
MKTAVGGEVQFNIHDSTFNIHDQAVVAGRKALCSP